MQPSDDFLEQDEDSYNNKDKFKNKSWKIYLKYCSRLLGVILFIAAIYVVQKEFKHLSIKEIKASLANISSMHLLTAGACTVLSFFVLSFYDKMAVKQIGYHLSFYKTAFAAFCSYVLSHNIGLSAVSGAMVRFRLYGNWGLKPLDILQVIAFCSVTYFLGVAVLIGALLIFKAHSLPIIGQALPVWIFILIGALAWLFVIFYIVISFRCNQLRIWKYNFSFPSPWMAVSQIVVATLEVIITAAIPYCIVPDHTALIGYAPLDFFSFMAIYVASYMAGLISSVPGGAGVFEGSMLLALKAYMPIADIMCVIFIFRLFYYLVPLFLAGSMFTGHEILIRSKKVLQKENKQSSFLRLKPLSFIDENLRESDAAFSVIVAAAAVFICGFIVLAVPLLDPVMWIPDGPFSLFIEVTGDYILSFLGFILLTLTVGLARRITMAWGLSLCILIVSVMITLIRGTPLFIPAILTLVAFFIAPFRNCYYRIASFCAAPLSIKTLIEVFLFVASILIINWLSPQQIAQYGIIQIFLSPYVPFITKLIIAIMILLGLTILFNMMLPAKIRSWAWSAETKKLYEVMADSKESFFSTTSPTGILICSNHGTAIPFIRKENFLVGLGDPVGNDHEIVNTIWRLRDLAKQENRSIAFWDVGKKYLSVYQDLGLASVGMNKKDHYVCCEIYYTSHVLDLIDNVQKKAMSNRLGK